MASGLGGWRTLYHRKYIPFRPTRITKSIILSLFIWNHFYNTVRVTSTKFGALELPYVTLPGYFTFWLKYFPTLFYTCKVSLHYEYCHVFKVNFLGNVISVLTMLVCFLSTMNLHLYSMWETVDSFATVFRFFSLCLKAFMLPTCIVYTKFHPTSV